MAKRTELQPPGTDRSEHTHRYGIGQMVRLVAGPYERAAAQGTYKVVAQLPGDGREPSYRIKSTSEPHERVARESQLTR